MKKETKQIQKIEYEYTYIADDGTEFKSEEECKKYEETAKCAVNVMFDKLQKQVCKDVGQDDWLSAFGFEDDIYAVKIRNANDVDAVNKWIISHKYSTDQCIGVDAVGTIQLFEVYSYIDEIWHIGTVEKMKEEFSKFVDSLVDELE